MKYRLGDICSITKGGIGIMKAIPGPYTMIALGETDKTHIEYQFDTKAVIIPLVSSTGHGHASMKRVKYCEGKFALGNILCAVIPNDESFVLAKYLHIYLHWNREELLVSQMKGMANVSLPMNRIADVMVTVPSIDKQREIIELEKQLVEKEIEADNLFADQLTQLENLKQAILQEAVQGKLVKQDPKDEPASELLKRIKAEKATLRQAQGKGKKEKPLPPIKPEVIPFEIPENWVWCRLIDVGTTQTGTTPPTANKEFFGKDIPFIKPADISLSGINYENEGLTLAGLEKGVLIKENSLMMVCIGGSTGKSNYTNRDVSCNQQINAIKGLCGVSGQFLQYFLQSPYFQKAIWAKSSGGTTPIVNKSKWESIPIPLPPLSEQKRIVAEIEKQLAKTKQLKEHIIANQQATEQLLKALLHQAFEMEEMVIAKPKGKVIELKPTNVDYYRRTVLAAEIVWQLHKEPTLGHLKLQKLIYLCQKSADMQLPTNFLRQAMGPYDNRLMRSIDKQLKEKKWFEYKKEQVFKYQPLEKAGQHHNDFIKYFSAESESIQFIIDRFKTIKSDIVEIVATLYACMNNMLNENIIFSEALLIQRFYEWSEEKKKFSEDQIKRVFSRMKETGIIPKGFDI
ncbi:restriction endonuclease subunit S [Myroides indicus]|uniref:Restriction endonuclease S subunit n=1 Tax=Myroides indicus TaxID=1323422 RepID=A0A4R7EU99_9FLAO|nr:restriction endonuclease subunit S [Myroides indicus]TDS52977.1 restriction endonuclease S subunit [Myroides indicus]